MLDAGMLGILGIWFKKKCVSVRSATKRDTPQKFGATQIQSRFSTNLENVADKRDERKRTRGLIDTAVTNTARPITCAWNLLIHCAVSLCCCVLLSAALLLVLCEHTQVWNHVASLDARDARRSAAARSYPHGLVLSAGCCAYRLQRWKPNECQGMLLSYHEKCRALLCSTAAAQGTRMQQRPQPPKRRPTGGQALALTSCAATRTVWFHPPFVWVHANVVDPRVLSWGALVLI